MKEKSSSDNSFYTLLEKSPKSALLLSILPLIGTCEVEIAQKKLLNEINEESNNTTREYLSELEELVKVQSEARKVIFGTLEQHQSSE